MNFGLHTRAIASAASGFVANALRNVHEVTETKVRCYSTTPTTTLIASFSFLQSQSTVHKNMKLARFHISNDDQTRLLQYKSPDSPFVVLRPNEQHVSDGGVRNPRFRPRQCVGAVFALLRSGPHAAGIRTRTRFGQTEATNLLSGSECWQILSPYENRKEDSRRRR